MHGYSITAINNEWTVLLKYINPFSCNAYLHRDYGQCKYYYLKFGGKNNAVLRGVA